MNEKVEAFEKKDEVKTHPCGEKSFWDRFKKTNYIKNLKGDILYESKGNFQEILEQAVKEKVDLSGADLRNQKFKGLNIPNAKLQGASFDGSIFENGLLSPSNFYNSDLRDVSFKNTRIDNGVNFAGCDVERTDFDGQSVDVNYYPVMKNFNRAYNIKTGDKERWEEAMKIEETIEKTRKEQERKEIIINPKPKIDVARLKDNQGH